MKNNRATTGLAATFPSSFVAQDLSHRDVIGSNGFLFSPAQMSDSHIKVDYEPLWPPRPFQYQHSGVYAFLVQIDVNLLQGRVVGQEPALHSLHTRQDAAEQHEACRDCWVDILPFLSPGLGAQHASMTG